MRLYASGPPKCPLNGCGIAIRKRRSWRKIWQIFSEAPNRQLRHSACPHVHYFVVPAPPGIPRLLRSASLEAHVLSEVPQSFACQNLDGCVIPPWYKISYYSTARRVTTVSSAPHLSPDIKFALIEASPDPSDTLRCHCSQAPGGLPCVPTENGDPSLCDWLASVAHPRYLLPAFPHIIAPGTIALPRLFIGENAGWPTYMLALAMPRSHVPKACSLRSSAISSESQRASC